MDDGRWTRDEIHYVPLPLCAYPEKVYRFSTRLFTNDAFWRVSADTKTCGSPLNTCHLYGGLYYTKFQVKNQVNSATDYTDAVPSKVEGSIKMGHREHRVINQ